LWQVPKILKVKRILISSIVWQFCCCLNACDTPNQLHNKKFDDKFLDKICRVPEVSEYSQNLHTKSNRSLKVWSNDTININGVSYALYHVGEDNGISLVTNFHFARNLEDTVLLGYDQAKGQALNLEQWRQLLKK
jgi:hypothetical protein